MSSDLSKFGKTMTLNCFSFYYYSRKSLVTEHTKMCWVIDQFFKKTDVCNKINMLTPASENEHLFKEIFLVAAS